jgi:hypothetical protein
MHANDDVLPFSGLYVPEGQGMHDDNEAPPTNGLYVPAGHAMQAALFVDGLYVPASQEVHDATLLPDELLKVPGAQSTQPKPCKLITEPGAQNGQRVV